MQYNLNVLKNHVMKQPFKGWNLDEEGNLTIPSPTLREVVFMATSKLTGVKEVPTQQTLDKAEAYSIKLNHNWRVTCAIVQDGDVEVLADGVWRKATVIAKVCVCV
jgi:hypothetical protein